MFDNIAMRIGQPKNAAGIAIGQAIVVEPKQMQDGGVQVMYVHWVFGNTITP